jgi:hypothetical protein
VAYESTQALTTAGVDKRAVADCTALREREHEHARTNLRGKLVPAPSTPRYTPTIIRVANAYTKFTPRPSGPRARCKQEGPAKRLSHCSSTEQLSVSNNSPPAAFQYMVMSQDRKHQHTPNQLVSSSNLIREGLAYPSCVSLLAATRLRTSSAQSKVIIVYVVNLNDGWSAGWCRTRGTRTANSKLVGKQKLAVAFASRLHAVRCPTFDQSNTWALQKSLIIQPTWD